MEKISIIIPAHNEQDRIGNTLTTYYHFFNNLKQQNSIDFELLVVLNGCNDDTINVVASSIAAHGHELRYIDLQEAGKGIAIIAGFKDAVSNGAEYIGFVDADMATEPAYFYELYTQMQHHDGLIASRYMPASKIWPARPLVKEWGRKLVYNRLVHLLFGLKYADTQCGAKLFKHEVIAAIVGDMKEGQWAFDVELLYLAKKHGFNVAEIPTVWNDKEGSKLRTFKSGINMLKSLFKLRRQHKIQ